MNRLPKCRKPLFLVPGLMGSYRQGSDVDITLKGELSVDYLLQIEKTLDDLMLPYIFDLSIYQNFPMKTF